jgi:hypothetical protein
LSPDDQTQLQTLLKKLGRHAESVSSSLKPWPAEFAPVILTRGIEPRKR